MTTLWPNGKLTPPNFSWEGHFGWRDAGLSYASKYHRGLDMYGIGTIHSIADGTVVHVGRRGGWAGGGYMVWIQHDGYFTRSLHLADGSALVSVGQFVSAGDAIGTEGRTNADGAWMDVHLHLEVTFGEWHAYNTGQTDPRAFLEERVGITTGSGGSAAQTDPSEEDDMRYIRNTETGRIYQVAPEFINGLKPDSGREKAWRDAGLPEPLDLAPWSFDRVLAHYGVFKDGDTKIVNNEGDVWNVLEGGGYERFSTWSRERKIERRQWEQMK